MPIAGPTGTLKADTYVLDTSALLTYFNAETGIEIIDELFAAQDNRLLISFLSLYELHYITVRSRSLTLADMLLRATLQLDLDVDYSNSLADISAAGALKGKYPLSAVDAWIAALAQRHRAVLVHKDPEFELLGDQLQLLTLPYTATAN